MTKERWTREQAWEWYNHTLLPYGCNFFLSTAINSTEMWQEESFDRATIMRELEWAAQIGLNSCRVFLPYLVWQEDSKALKVCLETFLALAAQQGLSVIPILFDDCAFAGKEPYPGPQDAPVPGVHNSGWTPSPGPLKADDPTAWPQLAAYIQDILGTFGTDSRILLWDLYNEPGNSRRGAKSLPLLEQTFTWAREIGPMQPLTSGLWGCQETDVFCLEHADVITFHTYDDASKLREIIQQLKVHGYPLICTEWMARTRGSLFATHLPIFAEEGVGSYFLGLVNGKAQTHIPWNSPPGSAEPELWFHDILYPDGTPYRQEELEIIQQYRPQKRA